MLINTSTTSTAAPLVRCATTATAVVPTMETFVFSSAERSELSAVQTMARYTGKSALAAGGAGLGTIWGGLKATGMSSLAASYPVAGLAFSAFLLGAQATPDEHRFIPMVVLASAVDALVANPMVSGCARAVVAIGTLCQMVDDAGTWGRAGWNRIG